MHHRIKTPWFLVFVILGFTVASASGADIYGIMPAALDQPHTNVLLKVTPTGDPLQYDFLGEVFFRIDAYYDTGASGILFSQETAEQLGVQLSRHPNSSGSLVVYQDVGVGGSQDFYVSEPYYVGIAKYHPDADISVPSNFNQTLGPFRFQVSQTPANDAVGPIDVVGIPAMAGKVLVIDPKPVDTFTDTMRTYVYDPGTPFNNALKDSEPGIPTTNHHVKLSYASFDQFTNVTPSGALGPNLAANPFIGPNPVTQFNGGTPDSTPGVTVEFNGLKTTGSFLFDTGAATSMISSALAEKMNVRYRPGTQGTDNPILERLNPSTSQWEAILDQFNLQVGGVGGTVTAAGFFLDSMLIRTMEGNASNELDPNHLRFLGAPVLINDITVLDPQTNRSLTLDGIFGMNNTTANALVTAGNPLPSITNLTLGNFNWVVFDQPNGILGLDVKPPVSGWTGNAAEGALGGLFDPDPNWSNSMNWEGVSPNPYKQLVFSQSIPTSTNNVNDFPDDTPFNGILFSGTAAFHLSGSRVGLCGDVVNNSTQTQTLGLNLTLFDAPRTFQTDTADLVVTGRIGGDQNLVKTGSHKLILKGANTFTGDTIVNQGTLTLDGGDLADTSNVQTAAGAQFEVINGTVTLGNIRGQGSTVVSNGVLNVTSLVQDTLIIGSPSASTVPEPASIFLLLSSLVALGGYRFVSKR